MGVTNSWALLDCNNFFVSCERVFRPDLARVPVLVLSSNDGCVVARSQEVKQLGIQMGQPRFEIEALIKAHHIQVFSSNYRLYADLSSRVMTLIAQVAQTEEVEVYSIDECFVRLSPNLTASQQANLALKLRQEVERGLGLPMTVGVAKTKTLAKLGVDFAKHDPLSNGTIVVGEVSLTLLQPMSVSEVWGIGRQTARALFGKRIETVGQFMQQPRAWVRQQFGLGGERTWRELGGESCLDLTAAPVSHRQILRSRSFGSPVTTYRELEEAVANYLEEAVGALRRQHFRASMVGVFVRTGRYSEGVARYGKAAYEGLVQGSDYLPDLMVAARRGLQKIFIPGLAYKKAGVILAGLESVQAWQPSLLAVSKHPQAKQQQAMMSVDRLNHRLGKKLVRLGSTLTVASSDRKKGGRRAWQAKSSARSPSYTSNWRQLMVVH